MNVLKNASGKIRFDALLGVSWAVLSLWAGEAAACTSAGLQFPVSTPVGLHEGLSKGDTIVTGSGSGAILRNCPKVVGSGVDLELSTPLAYYGEVNGNPTFSTSSERVGVQLKYQYIVDSNPDYQKWSGWKHIGDETESFRTYPEFNRVDDSGNVRLEVEATYVALGDIRSSESIGIGDLDPVLEVEDLTYGYSIPSPYAMNFSIRPRRYAYCRFDSAPPGRLELAATHIGMLRDEGDLGPAQDFSFSWVCAAGDDRDGGGDFQFWSTKALGSTNGLLAVDGDAQGVDMLVTMKDKNGGQMPVPLGTTWWATHHYHRGYPLPDTGSQEMQVRFRRNKDELKPGDASSTMTVHLSLF